MSAVVTHRFTRKDYHRMGETGVLGPEVRVELLNGEINDMSPIGPFHGGIVKRLNRFFMDRAAGRYLVSIQDPVILDKHSEPEPDLMLVKPSPDDYTTRHPQPEDVLLLVEVADTSLDYDQGKKIPAYARAGIPEVWLVNLADECVTVHRQPGIAGYESVVERRAGERIAPAAFPEVKLNLAELFRVGS
jgi:Uma2 family endonuclease